MTRINVPTKVSSPLVKEESIFTGNIIFSSSKYLIFIFKLKYVGRAVQLDSLQLFQF